MESKDKSQQQAGAQGDKQFDLRFCLTQAEPTEKSVEMALYAVRSNIMSAAFSRNHEVLDALQHELYEAMSAARALPSTQWRAYGITVAEVLHSLVAEMCRRTRPAQKDAWVRRSRFARKVVLFLRDGDIANAEQISKKFGKSTRWTRRVLYRMQAGDLVLLDDIGKGRRRSVWCRLAPAGVALQDSFWLEEKRRG